MNRYQRLAKQFYSDLTEEVVPPTATQKQNAIAALKTKLTSTPRPLGDRERTIAKASADSASRDATADSRNTPPPVKNKTAIKLPSGGIKQAPISAVQRYANISKATVDAANRDYVADKRNEPPKGTPQPVPPPKKTPAQLAKERVANVNKARIKTAQNDLTADRRNAPPKDKPHDYAKDIDKYRPNTGASKPVSKNDSPPIPHPQPSRPNDVNRSTEPAKKQTFGQAFAAARAAKAKTFVWNGKSYNTKVK